MTSKINNTISFGALGYNHLDKTKEIINSEFNTPQLQKAASDIFKKIDIASTKKGVNLSLDAEDYAADKGAPAARFISIYTQPQCDCDRRCELLDSYSNGVDVKKGRLTSEVEKMQELERFGNKTLQELKKMKAPPLKDYLKSFRNLFK